MTLFDTELESVCIILRTNVLEAEVYKHREQLPVVSAKNVAVDLVQPLVEVSLLLLVKRIPHALGCKDKRKTERRHFNYSLVIGNVGKIAPVFVAFGVSSANNTLNVYIVKLTRRLAARPKGRKSPQNTGKCLHFRDLVRIRRVKVSKLNSALAGSVKALKRLYHIFKAIYKILFGLKHTSTSVKKFITTIIHHTTLFVNTPFEISALPL